MSVLERCVELNRWTDCLCWQAERAMEVAARQEYSGCNRRECGRLTCPRKDPASPLPTRCSARRFDADRDDIGIVILLVANPGREVPQQTE